MKLEQQLREKIRSQGRPPARRRSGAAAVESVGRVGVLGIELGNSIGTATRAHRK
jgi:hypothetical protein